MEEKGQYLIGMDGGGTKTSVVVKWADGREEEFLSGPFNINGQEKEETARTLEEIAASLKKRGCAISLCQGIGVGCAGISNPESESFLHKKLSELGFSCRLDFFGDQESALASAFPDGCGMILIAGTGSVCYGKSESGKTVRAGGWGHLIDDGGSGYAIARDLFRAVARAEDGRGETTVMKDLLWDALEIDGIRGMIRYLYAPGRSKKEIASFAKLVAKAAALGDREALKIEARAADQLCELASCVIFRMEEERRLAFSGSVLQNNGRIRAQLADKIRRLHPEVEVCKTEKSAAQGALALLERKDEGKR